MKISKKSIGIGIGQLLLIVLIWVLNPSAMVEKINTLLLVFGIGCVTGLLAPIMDGSIEDMHMFILAITVEIIYIFTLIILWGAIQYNIVIL